MWDYPRKTASPFVTCVIAVGLVLRSFIAPGFMLDTTDGLAIIFCEGPIGAHALVHQDGQQDHHDHGGKANHQVHFTPTCTHWSISSLLVFNAIFEATLFDAIHSEYDAAYNTPYFQQCSGNSCIIRGPPFLI